MHTSFLQISEFISDVITLKICELASVAICKYFAMSTLTAKVLSKKRGGTMDMHYRIYSEVVVLFPIKDVDQLMRVC